MITTLVFTLGLGVATVDTDWGTVGGVTSLVPVVTASALHKNTELKITYGFDGTTDESFNGWYQEEAKVSDVKSISLLQNFPLTDSLSVYVGYGYSSFKDHGNPLGSSGWIESDSGHGYRYGIKYNLSESFHVNLGASHLYNSDKHWERMGGETTTVMYSLTVNYRF